MRKVLLCAVTLMLVSGCSTTEVNMSEASPVPSAFTYRHQQPQSAESATVKVVLDRGYRVGPCRIGFYIDGERIADLDKGEVATAYIAPGRHILGAGLAADASGFCKTVMTDGTLVEREAQFNPGEVRNFRILRDANAYLDVVPVSR